MAGPEIPWRPTWAHVRAVLLAVAGPLFAVTFHRADVLVGTAPLVIIAVWSLITRPSGEPVAARVIGRTSLREGQATTARFTVDMPEGAQEVSVSCTASPWAQLRPLHGVTTTLAADPAAAGAGERPGHVTRKVTCDVVARMTRWGHHGFGPAAVGVLSSWGAYQWGPVWLEDYDVEVTPAGPLFRAQAPMPHPQGLVGVDRSARPGEGTEFASIRPFQLGDRLRRIHWPSSLRSQTLNVTATYADHDNQVVVLVDATNDVGVSGGIDGAASTLDSTVRAAAALCEHYIRRGDRVGLHVTGAIDFIRVRSGTGRPHLRRMLSSLAMIRAGGQGAEQSDPRMRLDPGATVFVCSPLISVAAMRRAIVLAGHGLSIVVIDTLPESVVHLAGDDPDEDALTDLAWRIRMLEREADIHRVTAAGVPVVPWRGPGSLDQVLRDMGRRSRAPRLAAR